MGGVGGARGKGSAAWENGGKEHVVDAMEDDGGCMDTGAAPEPEFSFGQALDKQDDGPEVTNLWGQGGTAGAEAAAAAGDISRQQQRAAATPAVAVKQEPGATTAMPAVAGTPVAATAGVHVKEEGAGAADGLVANPSRLFAESPMGPAIAPGPATGWMEVYVAPLAAEEAASPSPVPSSPIAGGRSSPEVDVKQEGEGSGPSAASPLGPVGAAGAGAVALESDGKLGFYFLDAYENPDRPGKPLQQLQD